MKYVSPEMEIVEFDESVLTGMTDSGDFDNKNNNEGEFPVIGDISSN